MMRTKNYKNKRNYFGYILSIIAIILFFAITPFILQNRALKIFENSKINFQNSPDDKIFISINYLDIAGLFPGFSQKTSNIKTEIKNFYILKYTELCSKTNNSIISKYPETKCKNWEHFFSYFPNENIKCICE